MSEQIDIGVLSESFNEFLSAEWPREKAVAYPRSNSPLAADLWSEISALGWPALSVSEAMGGLGMGTQATAALHEALGYAAAPLPMLGTMLAVALVEAAGSDTQKVSLLSALADGSTRACVSQPSDTPLNVDGPTLNGTVADVLDAPSASMLFLRADRAGKAVWLAIPTDAKGVSVERELLADTTRSIGSVILNNVSADSVEILVPADPIALENELLRLAAIALAADALGGGNAVLVATIEYLKIREQFGRVIGSFQALKHRVADHKAALEAARGLVEFAAGMDSHTPQALLAALTAKQHVTRVAAEVARDCIQLHGGVGFTSEYVPHIYLKRAKLNEALFGTRSVLLDRIADMLEAA
jgi:alkylation response protein AidB-like acyl-CoA dehydrogenase